MLTAPSGTIFTPTLHSVYPHLTTVGEIFNRDPEVTSFFAGGVAHQGIDTGLDTPFDFPVYFALGDVLAHGKPMTELATVLRQDALYPAPRAAGSLYRQSRYDALSYRCRRFRTQAEIGAGAAGQLCAACRRFIPETRSGWMAAKIPIIVMTFPAALRAMRTMPLPKPAAQPIEQEVFAWTSGMMALRAAHPELQTGLEQNLFADDDVFAFVRTPEIAGAPAGSDSGSSKERFLIVINKAQHAKPGFANGRDGAGRLQEVSTWRRPRELCRSSMAASCTSKSRRSQ